jgi:hypothetical protein
VAKNSELSWSEKVSEFPVLESVSLVTPVTLSKDPCAQDIVVSVTLAVQSMPLPTISGRDPRAGGYGRGSAVVHATSCHSVFGKEDSKHPFFGTGVRDMVASQASWLWAGAVWEVACGAVCGGADCADGGAGCAEAEKHHKKPAMNVMPRAVVSRAYSELTDFIGVLQRTLRVGSGKHRSGWPGRRC